MKFDSYSEEPDYIVHLGTNYSDRNFPEFVSPTSNRPQSLPAEPFNFKESNRPPISLDLKQSFQLIYRL